MATGSSNGDNGRLEERNRFRRELVAFLFAFCITQLIVYVSAWSLIDPLWSVEKLAAAAHLVLAFVVIWQSWFGWRSSTAIYTEYDEKSPLGKGAVLAALDILIVLLYFLLVRTADLSGVLVGKTSQGAEIEAATPYREARLLVFIFSAYLLWDILSKSGATWSELFREGRAGRFWLVSGWQWPWPSFVCMLLSLVLLVPTRVVHSADLLWTTVCLDAALVANVLLFRVLKHIQRGARPLDHVLLYGIIVLFGASMWLALTLPV